MAIWFGALCACALLAASVMSAASASVRMSAMIVSPCGGRSFAGLFGGDNAGEAPALQASRKRRGCAIKLRHTARRATAEEDIMAKGQQRSTKEKRKPKKNADDKKKK